jgi:probable HAF family extracellular repeat protein
MRGKSLTVLLFAVALAPMSLAAAEKTTRYGVTDLGTLGGVESVACGLNDRAEITGSSSVVAGAVHAFLWREGAMTDLGTLPNDLSSGGRGINNAGQVAGASSISTMNSMPFDAVLWDDDEIIPLGTLGGAHGFAQAINQRGQVTGGARTPSNDLHAFLWEEEGGMTDLGTLPGDTFSIGTGINNHGQVVGLSSPLGPADHFGECPPVGAASGPQRAVLWGSDGTITDLGTLGGSVGIAKSINTRGVVVGSSTTTKGEQHAFLWRDGTMTDLGTLGGTLSAAHEINRRDRVVGVASTGTGEFHAFLWTHGRMADLNKLIPKGSGWILREATTINTAGQIAGSGSIDGQSHAFLLTPEHDDD